MWIRSTYVCAAIIGLAGLCPALASAQSPEEKEEKGEEAKVEDRTVNSPTAATKTIPAAATDTQDRMVVTGSRIAREDLTAVGPTTILREAEIANTGLTNAEVLLQRLPSTAGFGGNQNAAFWVGAGWGTAQVNLRGLGVGRTLVLLNGRRVVAGGSGANNSVDLNMIPTSILSRVEVLKEGASAVYGADAVAGVVNFITKDRFKGLETYFQYGQTTEHSDGEDYVAGITFGNYNEQASFFVDINYEDSRAADLGTREPCALADIDGDNMLECSPGSSSTAGGRAVLPDGRQINFIGGDQFEPFDIQKHGFNFNPFFNAKNPVERRTVNAFGDYRLTDSVSVFSEVTFNSRESRQRATPATLRNIPLSASHPTNPTGEDIVVLARRTVDFGPRVFEQDVTTWRFVVGLEGQLWNDWDFDVAFNWGRNTATDGLTNNINTQRLSETLDPSICGMNQIPCADILGAGDLTSAVGDYVLIDQVDNGGNEQISVSGNLTGRVFELPAGPLGFAAGFEFRNDEGFLKPDSLLAAGASLGNAQDPVSGEIEAKEIYAEINAPLLANMPMAESLSLDLAGRFTDYDLFGSDTNFKVGLNWQVIPSARVRGTYSTAFRVPSVPELFSGVREAQLPTPDPCSGWSSLDPSSALFQNCQAAGLPVGFTQFGSIITTDVGSNPNLQPEDATTYTIGAVFEPEFLPGLALTVDFFDIDIDDAITQTSGGTKLEVCYNSPNLSHPFCEPEQHTRDPISGEVNFLSAQIGNAGKEVMNGFDVAGTYDFSLGSVSNSVKVLATRLNEYEITSFEGDDPIVRDGFVGCCTGGYPEWRGNGTWTASQGKWGGNYNVEWIGEATDRFGAPGEIGTDIDDVIYHNVQISRRIGDGIDLRLGVDNLFDKDAPFVRSWTDGNTDTMTYSLLGRFMYARVTLRLP